MMQDIVPSVPLEQQLFKLLDRRIEAPRDIQRNGSTSDFIRSEEEQVAGLTEQVEELIRRGVDINVEERRLVRWDHYGPQKQIFEPMTPIEVALSHCNFGHTASYVREGRGPNYKLVELLLKRGALIPERLVDTERASGDIKIAFAKQKLAGQADPNIATSLLEREVSASNSRPNKAYIAFLIENQAIVSQDLLSKVENSERAILDEISREGSWAPYDGKGYDIQSVLARLKIAYTEQQGADVSAKATEILNKQLWGEFDSNKVYVSPDATEFLISKGASVDEALVNQFESFADERAGGNYLGNEVHYEDVGSLLNIAFARQEISKNQNAIHEKDADGFTLLDRAVRSRLTVDNRTRFYEALVNEKDIIAAAKTAKVSLRKFMKDSSQQKSSGGVALSDLKPEVIKKWSKIIESGQYPKAYQEYQPLRAHADYIKFLLEQGADVSAKTYALVKTLGIGSGLDNWRRLGFVVLEQSSGRLVSTLTQVAILRRYHALRSEELIKREVLPITVEGKDSIYQKMGIVFGDPVKEEPILRHARLPDGWTKEISSMDTARLIHLFSPSREIMAHIFYDSNRHMAELGTSDSNLERLLKKANWNP
jgi:hypothetical protein